MALFAAVLLSTTASPQSIQDRLQDVQGHRERGDIAAALETVEGVVAQFPDRPEAHLERGSLLAVAGRFEEAEGALRAGIERGGASPRAYLTLAKVLLRQHRYADALSAADQHAEMMGNVALGFEARYVRGLALRRSGRLAEAERELRAAVALDPGHADALLNLGAILDETGRSAESVPWLRKAAALAPANPDARYRLGNALARSGQPAAAERELAAFERIKRGEHEARRLELLLEQADASLRAGDAAKAKDLYQQAIRLDGSDARAIGSLGMAYELLGASALATAMFEKAASLDPEYGEAHLNLGLKRAESGNFEAALGSLLRAVRIAPEHLEARKALGMVLTRLGKPSEAASHFEWIVGKDPASATARLDLGIALAESGRHEEALVEFEMACQMAPDSHSAHYSRGRAMHDLGRPAQAREALARSIEIEPEFAPALRLLALVEREAGNSLRGVELYRAAIRVDEADPELHHSLGMALSEAGMTGAAVESWQEAISLDPRHLEALYNLGHALLAGDPDRGEAYLRQFAELKAEEQDTDRAGTLWNFALAEAKQERWERAFGLFEQALDVCGNCPARGEIHKNFGLVYGHSGDYARARAELLKAATLLPRDTEVRQALDIIDARDAQ